MLFTEKVVGNKVIARGRIVDFGTDQYGRTEIDLFIRAAVKDFSINVSFISKYLTTRIFRGMYVEVEGHLISYLRPRMNWTEDRKDREVFYFVADKVTPLKTEIEEAFGVKGGFNYGHMFFRCFYEGEVMHVKQTQGRGSAQGVTYTRFGVKTSGVAGNRENNIVFAQFSSRTRVSDRIPVKGDKVLVVANLSTTTRVIEGKSVEFSNLIVEDIVYLNKLVETKNDDSVPVEPTQDSAEKDLAEAKEEKVETPEVIAPTTNSVDNAENSEEEHAKESDMNSDKSTSEETALEFTISTDADQKESEENADNKEEEKIEAAEQSSFAMEDEDDEDAEDTEEAAALFNGYANA